mmetsp:Transcript_2891/g.4219  ORF Transcript_2891/g.4219 Transcript_2891/m.4219 type:complete len:362 (+) Transcript_2891:59-1144(+)
MGGICASEMENSAALVEREHDHRLDKFLNQDYEMSKKVVKILLLGAGECGKSTILKQMKILHKGGFSRKEKDEQTEIIRANTVDSMRQLIQGCMELQLRIEPEYEKFAWDLVTTVKGSDYKKLDRKSIAVIEEMWQKSRTIQKALQNKSDFYLLDSYKYFLDRTMKIFDEKYIPSNQDILQSRLATKGIVETKFVITKVPFVMYDVGGQRGQRKKWIHCFEGIKAIMFVASLSEYDQKMAEDSQKNRMIDSLTLFEGILSLVWFQETPIILFLNKEDVFLEKIKTSELGRIFGDYHGGFDAKKGLAYIKRRYMECNKLNDDRPFYIHVTTATNTENIEFVWKASKNIILCENLEATGLILR